MSGCLAGPPVSVEPRMGLVPTRILVARGPSGDRPGPLECRVASAREQPNMSEAPARRGLGHIPRRISVGMSGASGAIISIWLLQVPRERPGVETHSVVSPTAGGTIALETDRSLHDVKALADVSYRFGDVSATPSSVSSRWMRRGDSLLVRTAAAIAWGGWQPPRSGRGRHRSRSGAPRCWLPRDAAPSGAHPSAGPHPPSTRA